MIGTIEFSIIYSWISMLAGLCAGATMGLFFHKKDWLDGYDSFRRRIFRLGHIAFFGMAFVNLSLVMSIGTLGLDPEKLSTSLTLLVIAGVLMPTLCFLSGVVERFRHLFFIPVSSLAIGTGLFLMEVVNA